MGIKIVPKVKTKEQLITELSNLTGSQNPSSYIDLTISQLKTAIEKNKKNSEIDAKDIFKSPLKKRGGGKVYKKRCGGRMLYMQSGGSMKGKREGERLVNSCYGKGK